MRSGQISSFPTQGQSVNSQSSLENLKSNAYRFKGLGLDTCDDSLSSQQERWYREDFYPFNQKLQNGLGLFS